MSEARRIDGSMPVAFRYTPGVGNGAFFAALRADGTLLGSRCAGCAVTYVPARSFCERCLGSLAADTPCGPEGSLESWTTLWIDIDGHTLTEPERYALVRLDGADTVVFHRLLDHPGWEPTIGDRVRTMLRAERGGTILDIEGFGPAEASG